MVAAAHGKLKRLGLMHRRIFVCRAKPFDGAVGEQNSCSLYPGANILVATKKDFETSRTVKSSARRIATGDYDAVIIGHSQFETYSNL